MMCRRNSLAGTLIEEGLMLSLTLLLGVACNPGGACVRTSSFTEGATNNSEGGDLTRDKCSLSSSSEAAFPITVNQVKQCIQVLIPRTLLVNMILQSYDLILSIVALPELWPGGSEDISSLLVSSLRKENLG